MRKLFQALSILLTIAFAACDDNTGTLGIHSEEDGITNSTEVFNVTTRSIAMDSVVANSTKCYLGRIYDPETDTEVNASFAAQFHTTEDYQFPPRDVMVGDVDNVETRGVLQCDSCEVHLYFESYLGDDSNPMKLEVYELSDKEFLSEDSVYYTDIDLSKYLKADAEPIAERIFTPKDYNQASTTLSGSSYNPNVKITLPNSLGQRILEKYYEKPSNFADSYHFIRNVFPGLYFRTSNGEGTMLTVYVGTLNIFYRYADEVEDTVYNAVTRFASTPEVIQSTHFDNSGLTTLLNDNSCTYLKTPAGICTEMTLPIEDLFMGKHATDSISLARIVLTRYNKTQNEYQLGTPSELLMVRKAELRDFFASNHVANGRTSYTTSFKSSDNTYTFDNICRLLVYCKREYETKKAAYEKGGITSEEWNKYVEEWNKVVLVPVTTSSTTRDGYTYQVSVNHDLNLNSIRLVGGETPIKMQVVYSKFKHAGE